MRWYRQHPLTEGHSFWLAIAVGLGLLAASLISPAIVAAAGAVASDPNNPLEVTVFVTLTFAYVGVVVGGFGAFARAVAHNKNKPSDKIMDHVGKLLAAFAFVFSLVGASLRLAETSYGADYPKLVILAGLLIMNVALAFVPEAKRRRATSAAAAAARVAQDNAKEAARQAAAAALSQSEQEERDAVERERSSTRRRSHVGLGLGALALLVSSAHAVICAHRTCLPIRRSSSE